MGTSHTETDDVAGKRLIWIHDEPEAVEDVAARIGCGDTLDREDREFLADLVLRRGWQPMSPREIAKLKSELIAQRVIIFETMKIKTESAVAFAMASYSVSRRFVFECLKRHRTGLEPFRKELERSVNSGKNLVSAEHTENSAPLSESQIAVGHLEQSSSLSMTEADIDYDIKQRR
jgi:hypothetical protein